MNIFFSFIERIALKVGLVFLFLHGHKYDFPKIIIQLNGSIAPLLELS